MKISLLIFLTFSIVGFTGGENILFFFCLSTYSHRVSAWPLVEKLAEKGHNVTFLQPYKNKNPPHPNVTDIVTPVEFANEMNVDFIGLRDKLGKQHTKLGPECIEKFLISKSTLLFYLIGSRLILFLNYVVPLSAKKTCRWILSNPQNRAWIETSKFDVVVVNGLFNDCGLILAHKYGAKVSLENKIH